jgi:glucans biosynthesis protein C
MDGMGRDRRDHFWDAARALLMILGIPYHVALAYRPGQEWIVVSREGTAFFTYLAEFIHLFRMPAFFLIAGYFAALLLARREPVAWLRARLVRLGVPLVAAMLILVPPMNMAAELSNLSAVDALASWRQSSATSGGYWVRHLWFIIVLLYCSAIAAAILSWRPGWRRALVAPRLDSGMTRYFPVVLASVAVLLGLWEAGAVELFYKMGLATNMPQQVLRLDEFIIYAPWFLLGCLIQRSPAVLDRMTRPSIVVALLAIVATGVSLWYLDRLSPLTGRFVATIAGLALAQCVFAGVRAFLDRPIPLVQRLVAASFTIYLVHMPIVVTLVWLGQSVSMPVALKAAAIMLLTLVLSYGFWMIVERSALLTFLFDGRVSKAAPSTKGNLQHRPRTA